MKKYTISIIISAVSLFVAYNAKAQSESDTGRPIWVLGHACNSHRSIWYAIDDHACGVEIDVATNEANKLTDWSVAHKGYVSKETRKSKNARIADPLDYYVSLEEFLKFPDIGEISLLWLDLKTPEYAPELVQYVHRVLRERYYDKQTKQLNVPISIIYGFYTYRQLEALTNEKGKDGKNKSVCAWLRDSLWVNEGINLAYEGTYYAVDWSGTRKQIQKVLDDNNFPIKQHFMTNGLGAGWLVTQGSWRWQHIMDSGKDMRDDKYCARIGFWTCTKPRHGVQCVVKESDDPKHEFLRKGKTVECDVVLIECRSDFFPGRVFPYIHNPQSLKQFTSQFFNKNGEWYKYNNGHYRRANRNDKFYIRYSDPERIKN